MRAAANKAAASAPPKPWSPAHLGQPHQHPTSLI
jgi:hypothetical protein